MLVLLDDNNDDVNSDAEINIEEIVVEDEEDTVNNIIESDGYDIGNVFIFILFIVLLLWKYIYSIIKKSAKSILIVNIMVIMITKVLYDFYLFTFLFYLF